MGAFCSITLVAGDSTNRPGHTSHQDRNLRAVRSSTPWQMTPYGKPRPPAKDTWMSLTICVSGCLGCSGLNAMPDVLRLSALKSAGDVARSWRGSLGNKRSEHGTACLHGVRLAEQKSADAQLAHCAGHGMQFAAPTSADIR